jgi:hypothetical protein
MMMKILSQKKLKETRRKRVMLKTTKANRKINKQKARMRKKMRRSKKAASLKNDLHTLPF